LIDFKPIITFVRRENYYWELIGLPNNDKAYTIGPYRIWYPKVAPVLENTAITTILKGEILKLFERTEWRWNETDGSQTMDGETEQSWLELPEKLLVSQLIRDYFELKVLQSHFIYHFSI
jgi:hypothetical protein